MNIFEDALRRLKRIAESPAPQKTIRINYLFDGKEFKLSSKSVQHKKELDQLYNRLN